MAARPLGAACVIGEDGCPLGLVTDGDLRRALQAHDDIRPLKAAGIMTATPVTIAPDARLHDIYHWR
jgi:arabinose-5-phosphate isomerase